MKMFVYRRDNNRRRVFKKNLLKNFRVMNYFNFYSKVMRKVVQNVEVIRKVFRQVKLDVKRGVSYYCSDLQLENKIYFLYIVDEEKQFFYVY